MPLSDEREKLSSSISQPWVSTKVVQLKSSNKKPNPEVLKRICIDAGVPFERALYIGDSPTKDVWMANQAGVFSVWAKYGAYLNRVEYEKLVSISHWSAADVEKEKSNSVSAKNASPDFTCHHSFSEILPLIVGSGETNTEKAFFSKAYSAFTAN